MINKENMQERVCEILKDIHNDIHYNVFETQEIKHSGDNVRVILKFYGKNYFDIDISYDWTKKYLVLDYVTTQNNEDVIECITISTNDEIAKHFKTIVEDIEEYGEKM